MATYGQLRRILTERYGYTEDVIAVQHSEQGRAVPTYRYKKEGVQSLVVAKRKDNVVVPEFTMVGLTAMMGVDHLFPTLQDVFDRITALTKKDMKHKSIFALFASIVEEVGEMARELKIEEAVFGNTYKMPDEGSQVESVDTAISALALYAARGGTEDALIETAMRKLDKWEKSQNHKVKKRVKHSTKE